MSFNSQWDNLSLENLSLPYNLIEAELSEKPRLVAGSTNTQVTSGNKLAKRYGTVGLANTSLTAATQRIDRLWVYETLDSPPIVYLVASVYTSTTGYWSLYWCRLDTNTPWTQIAEYRSCNHSTVAHEGGVARGFFYARAVSTDPLGTVILDGTGGTMTIKPWGGLGSSTPAALASVIQMPLAANIAATDSVFTTTGTNLFTTFPCNVQMDYEIMTVTGPPVVLAGVNTYTVLRGAQATIPAAHYSGTQVRWLNWTASSHPVAVNVGWKYSYAYQSVTGHVTNLVALQTNPDSLPSNSGPFLNMLPQINYQGLADTTNWPSVIIFRTTDGGGTFFELDTITNPGSGPHTYTDCKLASGSGSTYADPIPDTQLNQAIVAPTLNSNSPPPAAPQGTTGVSSVVQGSPMAYYAGRWWFGLGTYLFYSGQEEVTIGVPEECWPSGTFGNFFRFQTTVTNVQVTNDGLYILTRDACYIITGTTKDTFNVRPMYQNLGAPFGHPRAICRFQDSIVWLTHDYRIAMTGSGQMETLSDELGTDLVTALNAGAECQIVYWALQEKQYILVSAISKSTPSATKTWVFDVNKANTTKDNFWYAPWTIATTCVAEGRLQSSANEHSLIFAMNNGASAYLAYYDRYGATAVDTDPTGATANYNFTMLTNLFQCPPGNHINALRRPGVTPTLDWMELFRTTYTSDVDPTVFLYLDDLWTDPKPVAASMDPMDTQQTKGYRSLMIPVQKMAQRVGVRIQKLNSPDRFELQGLNLSFMSTLGN